MGDSISSQLTSLPLEVQIACRGLASELQRALGYFQVGVVRMLDRDWGRGNGEHGGRILHAVLGGIDLPSAQKRGAAHVRAQWHGGRGKGRKFLDRQ